VRRCSGGRRTKDRHANRDSDVRKRLLALLGDTVDDRITRFVWLRQFEVGNNSADINRMLDRLDVLRAPG
jgi:hypothetical protein